jgi:myo-inositol-1(or 4)-monophosphatase
MIKNTLLEAIDAGSKELQKFFNGTFTVQSKGSLNDLVTEADHASEKAIFKVIQDAHPDHFILSEETGEIKQDSNYKWIIDPIDGTINFANGIPLCCDNGCCIQSFYERIIFCRKRKRCHIE